VAAVGHERESDGGDEQGELCNSLDGEPWHFQTKCVGGIGRGWGRHLVALVARVSVCTQC
jgi:hypothetical protein